MKLIVDMNTMELLEIDRADVIAPPAPVMGEYEPDLVPGQTLRTDIKPLEITQPDGPSFEVDGNVVRWQNWEFRLGLQLPRGPGHPPGRNTTTTAPSGTSPTACPSPR